MKFFLTYCYVVLFCFCTFFAVAQPENKKDKIDALRVSFIGRQVDFSNSEAQAFWPLYNECSDKLELLRRAFRKQYNKNTNFDLFSDKEAEAFLLADIVLKQKELDIQKEYYEKYKKVISLKKIALVKKAEEDFKKELIKNIKGNPPE